MSQYANESDLYVHGAPAAAFGSLSSGDKIKALQAASGKVDAAISSQGTVPLSSWGTDVTARVCHLATYEMLSVIGFNPDAGSDRLFLEKYNSAEAWLRDVGRGILRPVVTFSTTRDAYAQPQVRSNPQRGF